MRIEYQISEKIPKLAWCAMITQGNEVVNVECGNAVEIDSDNFVEGAWCGKFEEKKFTDDRFFLGTGAVLAENKICFATPNHTLERLYFLKEENLLYISNSLAFVLERTKSNLDYNYLEYEKLFHSILNGLDAYQDEIPLEQKDKKCWMVYYSNVFLDEWLNMEIVSKKQYNCFESFNQYYDGLLSDMKKLSENVKSKKRKLRYDIVTTISNGYDSAACAVIAKHMGCDTAVTFNEPEKYAMDDGSEIATKLGYKNIIKKNAEAYKMSEDFTEAKYIAGGELGTGIVFSAFNDEFKNKLVLIGEGGDHIWDKNAHDVNSQIRFSDELYSGTTLIEPRLDIGYFYLPLPVYCATQWPSIHSISNSDEMQAWSINNNYDRPIPRRIVEEAGIERATFGMGKMGAGFNYRYDSMNRLSRRMSDTSFNDFKLFYKKNRKYTWKRTVKTVQYILITIPEFMNYILRKCGFRISSKIHHSTYIENPMAPSYLFFWSIERVRERYSSN